MAKLKRLPTMDKSSRGRKSMTRVEQGGQEGVSSVAFKEHNTMGIGGRVLPYLHMILSCPSCTFALRFPEKQWALSGMEGQCHRVRSYPSSSSSSALISQKRTPPAHPTLSVLTSCSKLLSHHSSV